MFHDFKELLSAFNAHGVKYLIVGGYAVSFHAQPRATKDMDILVGPDPESFFRMGTPPVMVDIMSKISGVDFEAAWQRRVDATIDDRLTVPFISRQDLLAAKISAGRPQDLVDAAALKET